jgi:hypothetical protein
MLSEPNLGVAARGGRIVKNLGKSCLAVFLTAWMTALPALGANETPLGLVIQAQGAHLEGDAATPGANVYPGDGLSTETGGTLRLKLGGGQIYLLSQSEIRLAQVDGIIQASVNQGVVGFSVVAGEPLELLTPEGILKAADGKPAYGQVSLTSPTTMVVSSFSGELELDFEGDVHTISSGSSYSVSLEPGPPSQGPSGSGTVSPVNHHIVIKIIAAAVLGVVAYVLYDQLCESPSKVN